ncbi:MAG: Ig-like domain-containing protein, partial [Chitinophagales bacterium]
MKKILLSIFLTSLISFIYTQCGIGGLYTQKDFKFCQPEPQVIEYGIFEKSSIVFEENFNCGSICNTAWLSTPNGGNFTNPIFPSPTNDTYFFTSGLSQREFTTGPLDVSNGGNVYFEFRYSQGVIDGPDMYDEGLQLQYSLDGINWVDYQYYAPTGIVFASWQVCIPAPNTSYFYAGWAQICFELTPAMISNGTQFRWVQPNFSGASLDNWGLDNIKIFANEGDYQYYHINHSSPYLLGTGTFVDSFIVSSDTNIIIWGVNFSNNMQTFDTLSVEFPVLDSIFIVNTSNESTSNANDGTLTIGGLTIGDNYTSGIGLANSTEYTFTGLSAGNYNLTLGNFQGCPSNIINYDIFLANTSPIAIVDSVTILEDNFINIPVLNNDNDPNSFLDPSSVSVVSPSVNGYTIIDPLSGIIFYEPFLNFNGVDSFEYYVCDDGVPTPILCDSAWVIVTVNPVNDLPVAINDYAITYENIPALIDVLANDYDIDPFGGINATSLMILVAPSNGTYVVNATTGQITYTPNNNYIGLDSFSYIICDTGNPLPGLCDTAAVYIEVIGLIIEGVISTSVSNPLQNSKIYLIDYIAISDSVFVVDSTFTNSTGFYQFTNVFQNAYVKAIPDFSIYPNEIPTYYTSSSVFQTANAISLTGGIT